MTLVLVGFAAMSFQDRSTAAQGQSLRSLVNAVLDVAGIACLVVGLPMWIVGVMRKRRILRSPATDERPRSAS